VSDASETLTQVCLAGLSNAAAASVTNPIDVVKVRLQMLGEGVGAGSAPGFGVGSMALHVLRTEGAGGLYRGLQASLLREMSYSGIRMGLYEPAKQLLGATDPTSTSLGLKVAAGALTGATGSILANPLDLVKVRMQRMATPTAASSSFGEVLRAAFVEGGIIGLWRGCTPTVQRATLLTASQVPSYDHAKHTLLDHGYMREGYLCHFVCSMFAGVVAAAVTSPSDLVKSRMMLQPIDERTGLGKLYATTTECYLTIVRKEGPLALFKGFHSQWLRIGPHTTVSLMAFEQLRHLMGWSYL